MHKTLTPPTLCKEFGLLIILVWKVALLQNHIKHDDQRIKNHNFTLIVDERWGEGRVDISFYFKNKHPSFSFDKLCHLNK